MVPARVAVQRERFSELQIGWEEISYVINANLKIFKT